MHYVFNGKNLFSGLDVKKKKRRKQQQICSLMEGEIMRGPLLFIFHIYFSIYFS